MLTSINQAIACGIVLQTSNPTLARVDTCLATRVPRRSRRQGAAPASLGRQRPLTLASPAMLPLPASARYAGSGEVAITRWCCASPALSRQVRLRGCPRVPISAAIVCLPPHFWPIVLPRPQPREEDGRPWGESPCQKTFRFFILLVESVHCAATIAIAPHNKSYR